MYGEEFIESKSEQICVICVVCLDQVIKSNNNYCVSTCNHTFHLNCLLSVVKNKCPVCETLLKEPDDTTNENVIIENNDGDINMNLENEQLDLYDTPIDSTFIENIMNQLKTSELKNFLNELKSSVELELKINKETFEKFNHYCYDYDITYGMF